MGNGHEEVRLEPDQLSGEVGQAIELALRPAGLDDDGLALAIAQVPQGVPEALDVRGSSPQHTDTRDLRTRWRRGGEGGHEEAEDEGDKEPNPAACHRSLQH
jgi:hypothetical protein